MANVGSSRVMIFKRCAGHLKAEALVNVALSETTICKQLVVLSLDSSYVVKRRIPLALVANSTSRIAVCQLGLDYACVRVMGCDFSRG